MDEKKCAVVGLVAHVDAGKTTLAEAMLYCAGALRQLGRVDRGTAFLDCFALERERGITIFAKQAALETPGLRLSLLDTPGHADFSPETERALEVLDCAVLILSASEGVQSHAHTLWRLLRRRGIPTLIFWNKMDLPNEGKARLLETLQREFGEGFFDAQAPDWEALATCGEAFFEEYLSGGRLSAQTLRRGTAQGQLFPCWFGSALRLEGVEELLRGLEDYTPAAPAGADFGARVYRVSRDGRWGRLTHMKVTGGLLRPRDTLSGSGWEEKVTALYRCQGEKLIPIQQA
ncbi:MAG: GTP-binding protein, partial [Oscillospiraceae bacterium]|nr:GTP-binding protein [Oscillospiraceae bacterium]